MAAGTWVMVGRRGDKGQVEVLHPRRQGYGQMEWRNFSDCPNDRTVDGEIFIAGANIVRLRSLSQPTNTFTAVHHCVPTVIRPSHDAITVAIGWRTKVRRALQDPLTFRRPADSYVDTY